MVHAQSTNPLCNMSWIYCRNTLLFLSFWFVLSECRGLFALSKNIIWPLDFTHFYDISKGSMNLLPKQMQVPSLFVCSVLNIFSPSDLKITVKESLQYRFNYLSLCSRTENSKYGVVLVLRLNNKAEILSPLTAKFGKEKWILQYVFCGSRMGNVTPI